MTDRAPHFTLTPYVKPSPDGIRHPEVQLHTVTIYDDGGEGDQLHTHATDKHRTFDTLCGRGYFGLLSSSTFRRITAVDCTECLRAIGR